MKQVSKYLVKNLGSEQTNIFSEADRSLIPDYVLENTPFIVDKYRLNVSFYDLNNNYIETVENSLAYKVLGNNTGNKATQISVDPVQDSLNQGYLGDVIVKYEAFNDLFSPDREYKNLWIHSISSDRTEIRAKSIKHTEEELKEYSNNLQEKLTSSKYVFDIKLHSDKVYCTVLNSLLEINDEGEVFITLKLYEPLPSNLGLKSEFNILERINEPSLFEVTRVVEVIADSYTKLQRPNFTVDAFNRKTETTEYQTYNELLSKKASNLAGAFSGDSVDISIDHEDFSDFIHFSSAAERLQNFKYKFDLIAGYQETIEDIKEKSGSKLDTLKYEELVSGIISNFDHYDRFLYFESGSHTWPKSNSTRPFINETDPAKYTSWYLQELERAEAYDDTNPDILISTIPQAIREDQNNEPYIVFVHMIGQHFDNEWVYAKAISRKYNTDNRPNFGVSKDLVREVLKSFGISLSESGQNMSEFFKEGSTLKITGGSDALQPITQDEYVKEVYKRIYHNLPLILKSKGTSRCIRTLINCFGIPDSILSINVLGGIKTSEEPYLGPQTYTSEPKIRLDRTGSLVPSNIVSGSSILTPLLSEYTSVQRKDNPIRYSDDSHEIILGFELNKQFNEFVKKIGRNIVLPSVDSIMGDPRNTEENYGEAFTQYYNKVKEKLKEYPGYVSEPSQILWLVRYFDTMFFRSLKTFIPARDSVSTGAIVDDHILHRNRYKGVKTSWEEETYSGSIKTGFITGSDGGAYDFPASSSRTGSSTVDIGISSSLGPIKVQIEGVSTVYKQDCFSGLGISQKLIYDQSPKYNGELSGSYIKTTDGELNEDNPFKKLNANQPIYRKKTYSLEFPSPALCRTAGTEVKKLTEKKVMGFPDTFPANKVQVTIEQPKGTETTLYEGSGTATLFHIPLTYPISNTTFESFPCYGYKYLGWYTNSEPIPYSVDDTSEIFTSNYLTTGSTIVPDHFTQFYTPRFTDKSENTILFLISKPVDEGMEYRSKTDVAVSWSSSVDIPKSLSTNNVELYLYDKVTKRDATIILGSGEITSKTGVTFKSFNWYNSDESNWQWGIKSIMGDNHNFYIMSEKKLFYVGWFNSFTDWKNMIGWKITWVKEGTVWKPVWTKK